VAAWIEALVLLGLLRRRQHGLGVVGIGRVTVLAVLATAAASAVALAVAGALAGLLGGDPAKPALLLETVAVAGAGGATYLAVAAALRIPELPTIVGVMTDLLRRPSRS